MTYNPNIHHRRSIRLKGYDYSRQGMYFVTMCVQHRECLFGEIVNGEMQINDAGRMIEKWYRELANKFADIECGEMVVMPNHVHCIIINNGRNRESVGTDPRVCPEEKRVCPEEKRVGFDEHYGRSDENERTYYNNGQTQRFAPTGELDDNKQIEPTMLGTVIQWFKTMTTNEYIRNVKTADWLPFIGKLWQRNYYEIIIRNEQMYHSIAEYIANNPAMWTADKMYKS